MEQQQESATCLEILKNAESILHESETIATNNLEMLEEDGEKIRHIVRSTGMIENSLDMSVRRIAQMEHPFCPWARNTKTPRRNADTLALDCTSKNGTAQTWGMKGMLHKRMDWTKKWKTRYCIIDGDVLNYYKGTKQMQSKPRGTIVLKGATITEHTYGEFGRDKCFSITPMNKRQGVVFECPNPSDYGSWITWLRKAAGTAFEATDANSPNSVASLPASTTSGVGVATAAPSHERTRCCMGVEEDKALDGIIGTLDNLDRIGRTTKGTLDDQKHQLQSITAKVEQLDKQLVGYTWRINKL